MMKTEDMVFVFGSNLSGFHGAGAAAHAHRNLTFPWGLGEGFADRGPQMRSYALPTKGYAISHIPLAEVKEAVDRFIGFTMANQDMKFQVTQVGCGLGGFNMHQIAPLFREAPINCYFDEAWEPVLGDEYEYWGSYG